MMSWGSYCAENIFNLAFHYGIHSVELLLQLLGPGCESVRTTYSDGAETPAAVAAAAVRNVRRFMEAVSFEKREHRRRHYKKNTHSRTNE